MDDRRIIELFWERDPEAIREANRKYGAYCLSIAGRILKSPEDSEECLNDAWLRVWNAIPPERPARLRMYLAKIIRNIAFDRRCARSTKKRGGGEADLVLDELAECLAGESDVAGEYEYKELCGRVRQFVNALPSREGDIFLRRYFFTEPVAEIAARRGLSENHVTVILSRTRKKLKMTLQKEGLINEQI